MTIVDFYTTEFTVRRMAWDTDESGNDFSEEAEATAFSGHVQQASMELAQSLGLRFTKTFTVWCSLTTDVAEGDSLSDGTYTYHVKAKQSFENGQNAHLELVCERELTADDES
jgi:hypothetical protein